MLTRIHSQHFDALINPSGETKALLYRSHGMIDFQSPVVQALKKVATEANIPAFTVAQSNGKYGVCAENPQGRCYLKGFMTKMTKNQLEDFYNRVLSGQKLFNDEGVHHESR